ncbi:MAG: uroporphyrinogen-III synthase [Alphaproteobacteria bacterium]|nr:uroporphyrinogen-III synthase [Alphaproteobacteria bacterium]
MAADLAARGVDTLTQPLLDIVPRGDATLDLAGVQAVLLTSANGARVLADRTDARGLAVFAVGDATARAARAAGFEQVKSAGGNVEDLADLVVARLDPAGGALCHVAGSAVAGDLAGRLGQAGFEVRRAVLYDSVTASAFESATVEALQAGALDAVLFFSPRTAETFVKLVKQAGLSPACARLFALCLSPAVGRAAGEIGWRDILVADQPTQDALLARLEDMRGQTGSG